MRRSTLVQYPASLSSLPIDQTSLAHCAQLREHVTFVIGILFLEITSLYSSSEITLVHHFVCVHDDLAYC